MKIFYRISIFCVCVLSICFGLWGVKQYFYPATESREKTENTTEPVIEASKRDERTTCDTEYIIIEQNLDEEQYNTLIEKIPDKYIDKTREQLVSILQQEELSPILSEREKGLVSMKLSSFSAYRIVIIKQYHLKAIKEDYKDYRNNKEAVEIMGGFYLMAYDDMVYVYQSDKEEIYLTTNISLHDLPDPLVQEILDKKYLKDEAELYNFLESYSS